VCFWFLPLFCFFLVPRLSSSCCYYCIVSLRLRLFALFAFRVSFLYTIDAQHFFPGVCFPLSFFCFVSDALFLFVLVCFVCVCVCVFVLDFFFWLLPLLSSQFFIVNFVLVENLLRESCEEERTFSLSVSLSLALLALAAVGNDMPSLAAASASLTSFPAAAPMENVISRETPNSSSSSSSLRSSFFSPFFKLRSFPLRAFRIFAMAFTSVLSIATAAFGLRQLPWTWLSAGKDDTEAVEEEEEQEEDERREAEEQQQEGENSQTNNDSKVQPSLPLLWFPRFGRSVKEINEVQIRRDLALQPTLEDPDTERRVVPFVNSRGQTIFTQSWTPAAPDHPVK